MNDLSQVIRSVINELVSRGDLKVRYPQASMSIRLPELKTGGFREVPFVPTHRIEAKMSDRRTIFHYVHLVEPGSDHLTNFDKNFCPAPTPNDYVRGAHGYDVVTFPRFAFDPVVEVWWPYVCPFPEWTTTNLMIQKVQYESENDQPRNTLVKPPLMLHGTGVYFIQAGEGPIKIGYSSDVRKRLGQIQVSHSETLQVLAFIPYSDESAPSEEKRFHRKFEHERIKGEWFNAKPILSWLQEHGYWTP